MKSSSVPWGHDSRPKEKEAAMEISGEYRLLLAKGRSLDEIVKASGYGLNQLVREALRRNRLTVQEEGVQHRNIGLFSAGRTVTSNEVLVKADEERYARPTIEDAFLFAEQYPDEVRQGRVVFLHDPQYSWNGYLFSLVLSFEDGSLVVSFVCATDWHEGYRFALRKR